MDRRMRRNRLFAGFQRRLSTIAQRTREFAQPGAWARSFRIPRGLHSATAMICGCGISLPGKLNSTRRQGSSFRSRISALFRMAGGRREPSLTPRQRGFSEASRRFRKARFQPMFPSTVLMTRQFFERVGGFKAEIGRILSEDLEFMLRCAQHWPIGAIVEPVVGIRKHESNVSGDTYRTICGEIEILRYALKTHTLSDQSRGLISEQIILRSIQAGWWAFDRADFETFTKLLSGAPRMKLDTKTNLKLVIASFPTPIAKMFHGVVTGNNGLRWWKTAS